MNKLDSSVTIENLENGDKNLIFKDSSSFRHWLKKQRKTSFSVPLHMKGSSYSFQYIAVTKAALEYLHIDDNEAITVSLNKAKRGDRYYAFVEPKRLSRL